MAITYVGVGALASGTTTMTVTHPAGIVTGDLEVMHVVSGHPSNLTPSTPAGWDKVGEFNGGDAAAYGVGTGPRRMLLYTRVVAATNPNPVITMPTGTNVFVGARIHALHRTAGTGWRYTATFGEDTTSGTAVSVTPATGMTWLGGDFIFEALVTSSQTPTASGETFAAAGVTIGSTVERTDDAVATGGTSRLVMSTNSVTSVAGAPNGAPTITATLTVAGFAVGAVLRAREALATITATTQTAFPPRVLVAVAGMLTEDIVSISIDRSALNTLIPLRAAIDVNVTGLDSFVRTDGELPFGTPVGYVATLKDVNGDEWQIGSNYVTVNATNEVLSDPIQGTGVNVQIMSWKEKRYERETTVFNVSGRLIVVSGPNPGATSDLVLFTELTADHENMLQLLNRATNGIVQIRTQSAAICLTDPEYDTHAQVDSYVAVLATVLERIGKFRYPQRDWHLSVAEVGAWPKELEARGWTYADIDTYFTDRSYSAIDSQFNLQTYFALDTFDWGV